MSKHSELNNRPPDHRVKNSNEWLYTAVLSVTSFLLYLNSLNGDFVFDDVTAVVDNPDLRSSAPLMDLFKHDFWGMDMGK